MLTPTRAVADEVCATYGVDVDLVSVTHLGVSPVFFGASPLSDVALARMGIARPFVLATGTDAPRKNLRVLLDAWLAARGPQPGGGGPPPPCRGHLRGTFSFYFERGRPARAARSPAATARTSGGR